METWIWVALLFSAFFLGKSVAGYQIAKKWRRQIRETKVIPFEVLKQIQKRGGMK